MQQETSIPAAIGGGLVAFQGVYALDLAAIQLRAGDGPAQAGLSAFAGLLLLGILVPTWRRNPRALGLAALLQVAFIARNAMVMTQHPTGELARPFHSPFLHVGIDIVALTALLLARRNQAA